MEKDINNSACRLLQPGGLPRLPGLSIQSLSLGCCSEAVHSALSCLPGVTVVYIRVYLSLLMGGVSSASSYAAAIFGFAFRFPRGPVNEFVTGAHNSYFFCFMPQDLCSRCAAALNTAPILCSTPCWRVPSLIPQPRAGMAGRGTHGAESKCPGFLAPLGRWSQAQMTSGQGVSHTEAGRVVRSEGGGDPDQGRGPDATTQLQAATAFGRVAQTTRPASSWEGRHPGASVCRPHTKHLQRPCLSNESSLFSGQGSLCVCARGLPLDLPVASLPSAHGSREHTFTATSPAGQHSLSRSPTPSHPPQGPFMEDAWLFCPGGAKSPMQVCLSTLDKPEHL